MDADYEDQENNDSEEPVVFEEIRYDWESELEEYDEPDCYPCERDYQWVDEFVEASDDEETEITQTSLKPDSGKAESSKTPTELAPSSEKVQSVKDSEGGEKVDGEESEKKEGEGSEKKEEGGDEIKKEGEGEEKKKGDDEDGDEGDDMFILSTPVAEEVDEEKVEEVQKKRYVSVRVKKLIERGPKVHYEPTSERCDHFTNEKSAFRKKPFSMVCSFGFDSQRMANLHVLDNHTVVFMSGFVLTFFDTETKEKKYHRCLGGSCFGAIAIHPSKKLFAAAEKGLHPMIGIWSWPKLQLFRKLMGGTEAIYASVNFSPDGKLLASQGGEPDYLITVWNWIKEVPTLRVKSHAQDVFRVTFSNELAGNLTTAGLCHIKFWKMANTFTGLKLKGDIGRFGGTELSDIDAYIEMPDGKVVSGSEWGNLLVWENGLIVAEVCQPAAQPCHNGIVRQVFLHEGDFVTTGQDGWIRVWNYDLIDTAEIQTTEDSNKVSLKTQAEVQVNEDADVWFLVNDFPTAPGVPSNFWYAQDGKGILWRVDLSFLHTAKDNEKILTAHGGAVVACRMSDVRPLMATLCEGGQVRVYNYESHQLAAARGFRAEGTCLLWPSSRFSSKGTTIIAGFGDGTLRILSLSGIEGKDGNPLSLNLDYVCKPHSRSLTSMSLNKKEDILVTGGIDGNIFFFDARNNFEPLVFCCMPDFLPVLDVQWEKCPTMEDTDAGLAKILCVLEGAVIQEVLAPNFTEIDNSKSYYYVEEKHLRRLDFKSVKSQLRHEEEIERERLVGEEKHKVIDGQNRQKIENGEETEEEQNIRLLQEAEVTETETRKIAEERKKWKPFIPTEPSPIITMMQSPINNNEMLLSMGKYDTGYLYMVHLQDKEEKAADGDRCGEPPVSIVIPDCDDVAVTTLNFIDVDNKLYMGFEDGRIRLQSLQYPYDFENFGAHWTEGVHDCIRGSVTSLAVDESALYLVSTGRDGNVFQFTLNKKEGSPGNYGNIAAVPQMFEIADITSEAAPTLESKKAHEKELALLAEAKKLKMAKREKIAQLRSRFRDLVNKNKELPDDVKLTPIEFAISCDNQARKQEKFDKDYEELVKIMAWDREMCSVAFNKLKMHYRDVVYSNRFCLKAFQSTMVLSAFRVAQKPAFYAAAKEKTVNYNTPKEASSEIYDDEDSSDGACENNLEPRPHRKRGMDKFIYQKILRKWNKKKQRIDRKNEWHSFLKTEPTDADLKEEDHAISFAKANMGDMKLKTAKDYKVPADKKLTTHRGRKACVNLEELMFDVQARFNKDMNILRRQKVTHIQRMKEFERQVLEVRKQLEADELMPLPKIPDMSPEEDPGNIFKYTDNEIKEFKKKQDARNATHVTVVKKVEQKGPKSRITPRKRGSIELLDEANVKVPEKDRDLGSYVEDIPSSFSALEQEIKLTALIKARFNQKYLIGLIHKEMQDFDAKLKILRHRKVHLDYILKMADARMVMLLNDFIMIQESEDTETHLDKVITKAKEEKKDCTIELKSLTKKLEGIKRVMDRYASQKTTLLQEVLAIAGKAPLFEKYLIRVFKKKYTKPKEKKQLGEDDDEDDEDEDEDSSDDDDMSMMETDEDDDGLDIDLPPSELSSEIYNAVVEVRDRKFAIDIEEMDTIVANDETFSAITALKNRISAADREFDNARSKLECMARDILQKQNEMEVAVSMKKHQIFHMAPDLKHAIVTETATIKRLQHRIPELKREKKLERAKVHETKKECFHLNHYKNKLKYRLGQCTQDCDLAMMKKFGAIRNVEDLENFETDPEILNLRSVLKGNRDKSEVEIWEIKAEINKTADESRQRMVENSERLMLKASMIGDLSDMQTNMEAYLKTFPSEVEDTSVRKEIHSLKKIILQQWRSIHYLNLEIHRMSHKAAEPLPAIRPKTQ